MIDFHRNTQVLMKQFFFFPGELKLIVPAGLFSCELISLKHVFKWKEVKVVKIPQTFIFSTRTRKYIFNLKSELTKQFLTFSVPFLSR